MPGAFKINDYPFSRKALRAKGSLLNPILQSLDRFATKDVVHAKFDFTEKALDTTNVWDVAAGATATTWAISAGLNGRILGVGGTTAATSGLQLATPQGLFSGDKNAGMEIRYQIDDITECRLEFGFVDALPSVNTTVVNDLSTPTFNTTAQAALYLYDHTGSTTTTGGYFIGSDVDASKVATTSRRPVNDTYQVVRIQLLADRALFWIDGVLMGSGAIQGGDALKLAVSFKGSSTNDHNLLIDYIEYWADRS